MAEIDQETILRASMIEQQSRELEQQLETINRQIIELEEFSKGLKAFNESSEKEILSYLGKGVYLKTSVEDKKLFVEVGAGAVVRKTPQEAISIITDQIKRFMEMKMNATAQLEVYQQNLGEIIEEIESKNKK